MVEGCKIVGEEKVSKKPHGGEGLGEMKVEVKRHLEVEPLEVLQLGEAHRQLLQPGEEGVEGGDEVMTMITC